LSARAQRLVSRVAPAWLALFFGALGVASAQGLQPIPKLEARVTDLTGTLTADERSALEKKLAEVEAQKGAQLAVLIVPTTHPEEIEQYSIRVVEQWRIGRAHVDDGVLLIVAKNDRRMRIEVGYGLEGALPDATANRIITETIRPRFAQNDFYGGINAGVDQIIRVVAGEALPEPEHAGRGRGASRRVSGLLPFLFIAVFIGSGLLRAVLGRPLGAAVTGGVTGFLVWLFAGLIGAAVLASLVAFVFALLSGMGGGSGWSNLGRAGGFGGWGGGMGGMGGGGGFSGGGGGFGGGGSSGSW
jgi:uncharacterized protein